MSDEAINLKSFTNTNFSDDYKERLIELEERSKSLCTELHERLITLTTSTKSLREKVEKEKELWKFELQETIQLERKLSDYKWHNCFFSGDYNHQIEMLTHAVLKSYTLNTVQIQNEIDSTIYRQKLIEVESMCNLEMLKIRNSLEGLVPLQAILHEWNSEKNETPPSDSKIELADNFCNELSDNDCTNYE